MTMPSHLNNRQYSNKMSSDKKVLIGCGIGCATIIALLLIVIGFGGWWLFSPEDQVPTNRILSTGTSAAFRLEDISMNQDVMRLISYVSMETQKIKQDNMPGLPESLEKFKGYFESRQDPRKFVEFFAPKEATASLSLDETGKIVYVIAVNFGKGTRIVKLFLKSIFESNKHMKEKTISTERGELFLFVENNNWNGENLKQIIVGFYDGTFIISNDRGTAVDALDMLALGNDNGELKKALSDPFYQLSRKGCLAYGVLDGSLLKNPDYGIGPFKGELVSGMKLAEISLDNLSEENGVLNLNTDWNNKEFAAKANEVIEKLKPEWINKYEQKGYDMEIINSLKNEQLDIQFRVNNLKDSLKYQIQNIN